MLLEKTPNLNKSSTSLGDFKYFELLHSGHGLQNDDKVVKQWMEAIDEYLAKYMPVEK